MKTIAWLIGKLPFAGKTATRPLSFRLFNSMTRPARTENLLLLALAIVAMTFFHGLQVDMGVEVMGDSSPRWVQVVGFIYAAINLLVILTQLHLLYRGIRFCRRAPLPTHRRKCPNYSSAENLTMTVVTLGGQLLFLAIYFQYR